MSEYNGRLSLACQVLVEPNKLVIYIYKGHFNLTAHEYHNDAMSILTPGRMIYLCHGNIELKYILL